MDTTPLGPALLMRPKPLHWALHDGHWQALSALGLFTAEPLPSAGNTRAEGLWRPALNHAPFPIIAPSLEDARNLALLGQAAHGDLTTLAMQWRREGQGEVAQGYNAQGREVTWTLLPSEGTAGYYALRNWEPAFAALADAEQAKAACMQYAAYVWVALGEPVQPHAT